MSTRIANILRTFGYSPLTVVSGGMQLALSAGDVIVIHQEGTCHAGDFNNVQEGWRCSE